MAKETFDEELVPVYLNLKYMNCTLQDSFFWNLKERHIEPEDLASSIVNDLDLPEGMVSMIAANIRSQIDLYQRSLHPEPNPERFLPRPPPAEVDPNAPPPKRRGRPPRKVHVTPFRRSKQTEAAESLVSSAQDKEKDSEKEKEEDDDLSVAAAAADRDDDTDVETETDTEFEKAGTKRRRDGTSLTKEDGNEDDEDNDDVDVDDDDDNEENDGLSASTSSSFIAIDGDSGAAATFDKDPESASTLMTDDGHAASRLEGDRDNNNEKKNETEIAGAVGLGLSDHQQQQGQKKGDQETEAEDNEEEEQDEEDELRKKKMGTEKDEQMEKSLSKTSSMTDQEEGEEGEEDGDQTQNNDPNNIYDHSTTCVSNVDDYFFPYIPQPIPEHLCLITINVTMHGWTLRDQFEWNINSDDNKNPPEAFARTMCRDLGLPNDFSVAIAHSIREQLVVFRKRALQDEDYFQSRFFRGTVRSRHEWSYFGPSLSHQIDQQETEASGRYSLRRGNTRPGR